MLGTSTWTERSGSLITVIMINILLLQVDTTYQKTWNGKMAKNKDLKYNNDVEEIPFNIDTTLHMHDKGVNSSSNKLNANNFDSGNPIIK